MLISLIGLYFYLWLFQRFPLLREFMHISCKHLETCFVGWDNVEINGIKLGWVGGDWVHVTQEREQRRAIFNTGKNIKVP